MDLKSLLNDETGEADRNRPRHSSGSQSRSNTLPALQTSNSIGGSPGITRSRTLAEGQYPFPPQSSPGNLARHPSSIDYQYGGTSTYGAGSPAEGYPYTPAPAFVRNERLSGSAPLGQPLYRQVSQTSQASTPSSQRGHTPYAAMQSPLIPRQTSGYHGAPTSHPGTPVGPPMIQSPQSLYRQGPPPPASTHNKPGMQSFGQSAMQLQFFESQMQSAMQASESEMQSNIDRQSRMPSHGSRDSAPPGRGMPIPGSHSMGLSSMVSPAPPASVVHPMHAPMASYVRPLAKRQSSARSVATHERSQSASVSPKTIVTDLPPSRTGSVNGVGSERPVGNITKDNRSAHVMTPSSGRARSSSNTSAFLKDPTVQHKSKVAGSTDERSSPLDPSSAARGAFAAPALVPRSSKDDMRSSPEVPKTHLTPGPSMPISRTKRSLDSDAASSEQPPPKRRRGVEIPIWARRSRNTAPLPKYRQDGAMHHLLNATTNGAGQARAPPARPPPAIAQPMPMPQALPLAHADPSVPKLEPSFLDYTPFEDVHKVVCDFIFAHVVHDQKFKTGGITTGANSSPEGVVEIEAKIGTLIDRSTGQRLALPIQSEVVIHPNYDLTFESMMTEQQHRYFNDMLNDAVGRSHATVAAGVPRVKIQYQHRREIDSFYTLPTEEKSSLPETIRPFMQRNPKVRVSKDAKTGEILAQIVKVRIGDLHIHSPLNDFDYRISISAECNWPGSIQQLMAEATKSGSKAQPDRHKDRMSYTHQFCNIDLTQVKPSAVATSDHATHELEVELDSDYSRRQGMLAASGQPNKYEEVVKIFLNNVRLLIKRPPPQAAPPQAPPPQPPHA